MAIQDLVAAAGARPGLHGPTFLSTSPHHGNPRRTKRLQSPNQRDLPISELLGSGDGNDGLPCGLSPMDIPCWTALPCSTVAQALKQPGVDPAIAQLLSPVVSSCTQLSDLASTVVVSVIDDVESGLEFLNSDSPTLHPSSSLPTSITPSSAPSSHTTGLNTNTGSPGPLPTLTDTSTLTHTSSLNQSITNTVSTSNPSHDTSSSLSISSGSEGGTFNGSVTSKAGALLPVEVHTSTADSPGLPPRPFAETSPVPSAYSNSVLPSSSTYPLSSVFLPPGGLSPSASPTPEDPHPHHRNVGVIIAIVLGALALLLCIAFVVLYFFRRRARAQRKARRTYSGSPWQRLKPHVYDGSSSRPESSIWTWFGSIPIDTEYKPQPEPRPYSPEAHFAEKDAVGPSPAAGERLDAPSPRTSPCLSPAPSDTALSSARLLHEGLPYVTVRASSAPALEPSSSSAELLALAGTDYYAAVANPFSDIHEVRVGRSVSGVSRTTASSGEVQSVEAL